MALDTNKISNIPGTILPQKLIQQLNLRSKQNSRDNRLGQNGESDNLLFLANKSAWVRLVSSIDIIDSSDITYFNDLIGGSINNPSDLAKQFVLFGGTSKYLGGSIGNSKLFSYSQRSGFGQGGSYGMLGDEEIKRYGYKPMPGITSVNVETLGRLGSLRQATINFKCWDKLQLDIIDSLYFKLGFTMFLEWGSTFFYSSDNPDQVKSSELYSIDPFASGLTKEEINIQIARNIKDSEYNYDAMLGIVTNFNFELSQDGGYDCTLKLTALGVLSDSTKINNPSTLAKILEEEIVLYNQTIKGIEKIIEDEIRQNNERLEKLRQDKLNEGKLTAEQLINKYIKYDSTNKTITGGLYSYASNTYDKFETADLEFNAGALGPIILIRRLNGFIPQEKLDNVQIKLDYNRIQTLINVTGIDLYKDGAWSSGFFDADNVSTTWNWDSDSNKLNYELSIKRARLGKTDDNIIGDDFLYIPDKDFVDQFFSVLKAKNSENEYELTDFDFSVVSNRTGLVMPSFTVKIVVPFSRDAQVEVPEKINPDGSITPATSTTKKTTFNVTTFFTFQDSSFIKSFTVPDVVQPIDFLSSQNQQQAPAQEDQNTGQDPDISQIAQSLSSQSGLELALRTIQVHALARAAQKTLNLDINNVVFTLSMTEDKVGPDLKQSFYEQIFTNGIFSPCIKDLVNGSIKDTNYTTKQIMNPADRFKIQAKYGFATELMSGRVDISSFENFKVDYKELLKAFVVPYRISQEIVQGTTATHPVYIPFGLLLMLLNHNCTSYDVNNNASQTPLVYIDFNPNLNFLLTTRKHLSTNPLKVLIPFEGNNVDYLSLFPSEIIGKKDNQVVINPISGSKEATPIFDIENQDRLSSQIPSLKYDPTAPYSAYKGKLMSILLNVDYIVDLIRERTISDPLNNVYLKPFLEVILSDINKYLGNFNVLRLSYNDGANTYQIVDDQVIPPTGEEKIIEPKDSTDPKNPNNYTTALPLVGKYNIAKSISIKTDISSKLGNMLAISSNYKPEQKAQLSTDASSVGFINTSYKDRYIPIKGQLTSSGDFSEAIKTPAIQFNKSVEDFYSTVTPSEANVSQVTGYYIDRMAIQKNLDHPTKASTPIPLSVNFTIDGISGFVMGQAFTIPSELIPYTYNIRNLRGEPGLGSENINKVGFFIAGLTNTIENNQWNTSVRANMTYLKYANDFNVKSVQPQKENIVFEVRPEDEPSTSDNRLNVNNFTNYPVADTTYSNIKYGSGYLGSPATDRINPTLLSEINTAASRAGVIVTVTTAVSGHDSLTSSGRPSRHSKGNAVDIAIVNGVAVSNKQQIETEVNKFVAQLKALGYIINAESGNSRAVLTYGFANHDDHIHISNTLV